MILEASIRHKFIYKQELNASFILFGAVTNEFDQVLVVNHAQNIDLSQPLLMSLHKKKIIHVKRISEEKRGGVTKRAQCLRNSWLQCVVHIPALNL